MMHSDTTAMTAARRAYVTAVQQLVDAQSEVLFGMVTAAAEHASTGTQHIAMTHELRSLTAAAGGRAAVFRVEAITDRPENLRLAGVFKTGQARCSLPMPDGTTEEWVLILQHVGTGERAARHTWLHARALKPVNEAMMTTTLRFFFA